MEKKNRINREECSRELLNLFVEDMETERMLGLLQNLNRNPNSDEQLNDHTVQPSLCASLSSPNIEVTTLEELVTRRNLPVGSYEFS